jgi:RNA polymerase sigma factor (sigma-70 family)
MDSGPGTTHFGRLLDRIRAGDPTAKDQLINDAYQRVHALAHFMLRGEFPTAGRAIETDDVVSESLEKFTLKLREGLSRVPDSPAELFGYVATIIRNVVKDEVRRRLGRQFRTQFPPAEVPADEHDRKGEAERAAILERLALQEAVGRLPDDERRLIDMRYVWGMSDDEIGIEQGCDPSTARRRIRRILPTLRRMIEPADAAGEA